MSSAESDALLTTAASNIYHQYPVLVVWVQREVFHGKEPWIVNPTRLIDMLGCHICRCPFQVLRAM
jgi:hypothetical protein